MKKAKIFQYLKADSNDDFAFPLIHGVTETPEKGFSFIMEFFKGMNITTLVEGIELCGFAGNLDVFSTIRCSFKEMIKALGKLNINKTFIDKYLIAVGQQFHMKYFLVDFLNSKDICHGDLQSNNVLIDLKNQSHPHKRYPARNDKLYRGNIPPTLLTDSPPC